MLIQKCCFFISGGVGYGGGYGNHDPAGYAVNPYQPNYAMNPVSYIFFIHFLWESLVWFLTKREHCLGGYSNLEDNIAEFTIVLFKQFNTFV